MTMTHGASVEVTSPASSRKPALAKTLGWIGRRLVASVVVLFLVSVVVSIATQLLPSDPARIILGELATPQMLDAFRSAHGLNDPYIVRYERWLASALTGDFGASLANGNPVAGQVFPALANSLILTVIAIIIAVPLSTLIGAAAATRARRASDQIFDYVMLALSALPEVVKGTLLVLVFATAVWRVLPAIAVIPPGASPLAYPRDIVLPLAVLVLSAVPYLSRLIRASLVEVLASEYVQMARLKGLSPSRILWRHALPNAVVPAIQGAALCMALMLGGAVVIEYLFRYPGIGALLTDAVRNRDLPMLQALIMVYAAVYMLVNLAAELLMLAVSPEMRAAGR